MILVDSSVWIDYFRGAVTPQTETLDRLLNTKPLLMGDLMLTEVLQGFRSERDFESARRLLTTMETVELGGRRIALRAAENFRFLRSQGITVRKTIDTIIATKCIESGYALLHSDRDFEPFTQYLGLEVVMCEPVR